MRNVVDAPTADWLRSYRFTGDMWGYPEGEVYVPGSPLLVVEGTFAEAVLLETLCLSVLNHDCAVAAAASRTDFPVKEGNVVEGPNAVDFIFQYLVQDALSRSGARSAALTPRAARSSGTWPDVSRPAAVLAMAGAVWMP